MSMVAEKTAARCPAPEPATGAAPSRPSREGVPLWPTGEHRPAHLPLICAAAPAPAISAEDGQLRGEGLEGLHGAGDRVLSRCQLRVAGQEPVPDQGRTVSVRQASFVARARTSADNGHDPQVTLDRVRSVDSSERICLRSASGRTLRLPMELHLGTDLAEVKAIPIGRPG
ncbi:glycogen debranching N-terminal domain-containing protein [Streptomyces iconiensis]|uniref:glycogen debranching N-terminal domain-containing protein n=1 Tax=Streptomyces iconiensis TaxID=1384038 RepID=UPI003D2F5704